MTFLSKIGSIILKATQIVMGFAPLAEAAYPQQAGTIQTISQDLAQIANIITLIEASGQSVGLTGPQKLQAAAPNVAQVILQSTIMKNTSIANQTLFMSGSTKIADGMADILNSLHDNVQTQNKA